MRHFAISIELDAAKIDVLAVYIQDVERKLAVFDELYKKIDLFKRIVDRRFQYKSLCISKSDGFFLQTSSGRRLEPDNLSSGEQHEIVVTIPIIVSSEGRLDNSD